MFSHRKLIKMRYGTLMLSQQYVMFRLLALLSLGNGIYAQQNNGSLMLQISGDLWAWSSAQVGLIRRTSWGYNQTPLISPDGTMAAYKSTASLVVDVIKKSGPSTGSDLPANIWVMNFSTGEAIRIVDQPPDASFMQPD